MIDGRITPASLVGDAKRIAELEQQVAELQHARQEAMRYGRKNFDAAQGFQERAIRAEARAGAAEQQVASLTEQLAEAQLEIAFQRHCRSTSSASIDRLVDELDQLKRERAELRIALLDAALSLEGYDASYGGGGGEGEAYDIAKLLGFDGNADECMDWLQLQAARARENDHAA